MGRKILSVLLSLVLVFSAIVVGPPHTVSAAVEIESFLAPAEDSGSIEVKLYPMENVNAGDTKLVTFGVPFTKGSMTVSGLSKVRVLKGDTEIPAYVEQITPWRHLTDSSEDGKYVRIARIQFNYTFTEIYPNYETITVEWGEAERSQSLPELIDPKTAWHKVTSGTFSVADDVYEPDVYSVLPPEVLTQGVLSGRRSLPIDESVSEERDDPNVMDATDDYEGFLEYDHAIKNFFYTTINEDDPKVTAANQCKYKTDSEPWLYDRSSTMFNLYFKSGFVKALREAVRSAQFYKNHLYPDTITPARAIGLFDLKNPNPNGWAGGNGAMYSYNECFAYTYWLTGDEDVLDPIKWVNIAHELNDEPTRWSPSLGTWTERHTAIRLLSNVIAYEIFGDCEISAGGSSWNVKDNVLSQIDDFVWHQNGAGGAIPADRVDGGLYHYGSQHGDGEGSVLVASTWMSSIFVSPMLRAYAMSEDPEIADFIRRLGAWEKDVLKYDDKHVYDTSPEPMLWYPAYMVRWDGQPDFADGGVGDEIDHSLEIASTIAWGGYFADLLGKSDPDFYAKALALYYSYNKGVNHWTRPTGPETGRAAYRVTPWRKYNWEYYSSEGLSWLMNQITDNGGVMPTPPPTPTPTPPTPPPPPPTGENLLLNPGFEEDLAFWDEDWGGNALSTLYPHSGSKAIEVSEDGGRAQILDGFTEGEELYFEFWGRSDVAGNLNSAGVDCLDGNEKKIPGGQFEIEFDSAEYQKYSLTLTTVPGTQKVQVWMWGSNGKLYCDDFVLARTGAVEPTPPPTSENLVLNPGFEEDLRYWDEDWGNTALSTLYPHTGTKAIEVGEDGGRAQLITGISEGQKVYLEAWARVDAPGSDGAVGIDFLGADGKRRPGGKFDTEVTSTDYQKYTLELTAVPGTTQIHVWMWGSNGKMYCDDFVVTVEGEVGPTPTPTPPPPPKLPITIFEDTPTFNFGAGAGTAVIAEGEGVDGSACIKYTGLTQWAYPKRLDFSTNPINITNVTAEDKLQISLDLGEITEGNIYVFVYFNGVNESTHRINSGYLDKTPGFQTLTLDLSTIRANLGDTITEIGFSAGNGWPAAGNFWVDNIKLISTKPPEPMTYHVGPDKEYKTLAEVADILAPGDTVLIDGDHVYASSSITTLSQSGTEEQPITIRGITVNGRKPVLKGTTNKHVLVIEGDNCVIENLEIEGNLKEVMDEFNAIPFFPGQTITYENLNALYNAKGGASNRRLRDEMVPKVTFMGIRYDGNNTVIRDCIVHDCRQGILGNDIGSGSILIEYCEVYHNGAKNGDHNLYLASDESRYPDAVARVQFCYIHDSLTGNGLKTRAARNEIYYNRLENNCQNALELCGPDPGWNESDSNPVYNTLNALKAYNPNYDAEDEVREDSDIVGNVIITRGSTIIRLGGDGTGQTWGRYRIVNNTLINMNENASGDPCQGIRMNSGVESVEMFNNIFYNDKGTMHIFFVEDDPQWFDVLGMWASKARSVKGSHNWVRQLDNAGTVDEVGAISVPEEWTDTIMGVDPGFTSIEDRDFTLKDVNEVAGKGTENTVAHWDDWTAEWEVTRTWTKPPIEECTGRQKSFYSNTDNAFPNPLQLPLYLPVDKTDFEAVERIDGAGITIGAYTQVIDTSLSIAKEKLDYGSAVPAIKARNTKEIEITFNTPIASAAPGAFRLQMRRPGTSNSWDNFSEFASATISEDKMTVTFTLPNDKEMTTDASEFRLQTVNASLITNIYGTPLSASSTENIWFELIPPLVSEIRQKTDGEGNPVPNTVELVFTERIIYFVKDEIEIRDSEGNIIDPDDYTMERSMPNILEVVFKAPEAGTMTVSIGFSDESIMDQALNFMEETAPEIITFTVAKRTLEGGDLASLWAVNDSESVKRDDLDNPNKASNSVWDGSKIKIFGAKNEIVAFQVIAEAGAEGINELSAALPALTHENGEASIVYVAPEKDPTLYAGRPIQIFSEGYMNVTEKTRASWILPNSGVGAPVDWDGWIPVQLIPENAKPGKGGFPLKVNPGQNQGLWFDIYIDRDLPAGIYTGTVTVTADDVVREIPIELEVLDFVLPDENIVNSMLYFETEQTDRYQGEGVEESYHRLAKRNRVEFVNYYDLDSAVEKFGYLDGSFFTEENNYEGPGEGVGYVIVPRTFYGTEGLFDDPVQAAQIANEWMEFLNEHFPGSTRFNDVTSKITFVYLEDEAPSSSFPAMRQQSANIKASPGLGKYLPVLATKSYNASLDGDNLIDIWATTANSYNPERAAIERSHGDDMWFYNGRTPYAGSFDYSAPVSDPRATIWGSYKQGVDVYYYWHVNHWTHNSSRWRGMSRYQNMWLEPITFRNSGGSYANGDGVLVFHGENYFFPEEDRGIDGPISTLRLANLRRGEQDVLYLDIARKLGLDDAVNQALLQVVPNILSGQIGDKIGFATTGNEFEVVRLALGKAIEEALAGGENAPVITVTGLESSMSIPEGTLNFTAEAADKYGNPIAPVVKLGDTVLTPVEGNSYSVTLTKGTYTISVEATDSEMNYAKKEFLIEVLGENKPDIITAIVGAEGKITVTLEVVDDPDFPVATQYRIIDGTTPISALAEIGQPVSVDVAKFAGDKVYVQFYDSMGIEDGTLNEVTLQGMVRRPLAVTVEESGTGVITYTYSVDVAEGVSEDEEYEGDYYVVIQLYYNDAPALTYAQKFNTSNHATDCQFRIGADIKLKIMVVTSFDVSDEEVLVLADPVEVD